MNNRQMGMIAADMMGALIEKMNSPEISLPPPPTQAVGTANYPNVPSQMPFQEAPYTSTLEPLPVPSAPVSPEFNEPPPIDNTMQPQLPSFTSMREPIQSPNYDETEMNSLRSQTLPPPNAY